MRRRREGPPHLDAPRDVRFAFHRHRREQHTERRGRRVADAAIARRRHDRAQRSHAVGRADGEKLRDHPAHRHPDEVRGADVERVEQPHDVVGHVVERVRRGRRVARHERADVGHRTVVDLRRQPDVAVVEAYDAEAAPDELAAEALVPLDHLQREAHHEDDRRIGRGPERVVLELDAVGACAHGERDTVFRTSARARSTFGTCSSMRRPCSRGRR